MKYVKLFEEHTNTDELKQQIQEYLNQEYTENWYNSEFSDRVSDYISPEDVIGGGDEDDPDTWEYEDEEDAYRNLSTGYAIEYDLVELMRKDVCEKFGLTDKQYFDEYKIDDIVDQHLKDNAKWCDPMFGQSISSFFSKGVNDLMKRWDDDSSIKKDDDGNDYFTTSDGTKIKI